MVISIHIYTDNAAFEPEPDNEVARILHKLSTQVVQGILKPGASFNLMDINGNVVGSCVVGEEDE